MRSTVFRPLLAGALVCLAVAHFSGPVSAQPSRPLGVVVGAEPVAQPRFIVKAVSFECKDQTGWDFWSSDEVVFAFRTSQYGLYVREYGNINSDGTVHKFKPREECIAPAVDNDGAGNHVWQCGNEGVPGPISFTVGAYEQDEKLIGFCVTAGPSDLFPADFVACEEKDPNDLIGKEKVEISLNTLLDKLRQVGQSFTDSVDLHGGCDNTTSSCPFTAGQEHYKFIYSVTRVTDAVVNPLTVNPLPVDPNPSPPGNSNPTPSSRPSPSPSGRPNVVAPR